MLLLIRHIYFDILTNYHWLVIAWIWIWIWMVFILLKSTQNSAMLTLSRCRTQNEYTRWRLISALIYKITWWFVLLKNCLSEFSVLRACPLQWPTMSRTLIVPRILDRRMTSSNQLCSSERPMCAHWVVFPLECPVSHIVLTSVSDPVPRIFPSNIHAWLLFARIG